MAQEALAKLIASVEAVITYVPLRTEVDFRTLVAVSNAYEIAPRAALDPVAEALNAIAFSQNQRTVILIPGRAFDTTGTRHGQGGGWYDRFLTRVPAEWTRIGFCFADQLSKEPLRRESWDQVMDYVVVVDRASGIASLHATGARA